MCSCSFSHREVDCSWRGLRQLPEGLQHNMRSLNLSHNRFHNLDGQLKAYSHLRILDFSHNRLSHLPTGLPRSLWQLHAASNRLHLLDKNDTAYQWNLRLLDLSNNKLQRATFINNTLINLCTLNLSHNNFWTLPTNMPIHLEALDLSHNLIAKVLPGSLDRLVRLSYFYLHANRFSTLPFGVLDKMTSLTLITLGDNPWACHLDANITYLLSWIQHTPARVLGCPCHTQPVCGGVRTGRTRGWHFVTYNLPPMAANAQDLNSGPALLSTPDTPKETLTTPRSMGTHLTIGQFSTTASPAPTNHMLHTDSQLFSGTEDASSTHSLHTTYKSSFSGFITEIPIEADVTLATDQFFTTQSPYTQTKKTTTLRTRSVRRPNQSHPKGISSNCPAFASCSLLPLLNNLGLLSLIVQQVLWKANEKHSVKPAHPFTAHTRLLTVMFVD